MLRKSSRRGRKSGNSGSLRNCYPHRPTVQKPPNMLILLYIFGDSGPSYGTLTTAQDGTEGQSTGHTMSRRFRHDYQALLSHGTDGTLNCFKGLEKW
jgi:hypothetical protein